MLARKKILFLITKNNWGSAVLETHGFPTFRRLPPRETSRFPDPFRRPTLITFKFADFKRL